MSAAPFRRCDYKTLGLNPLCDPNRFHDTDEGFRGMNPPIWGTTAINQYKQAYFKLFKKKICDNSNLFFRSNEVPDYINNRIQANMRNYTTSKKVTCFWPGKILWKRNLTLWKISATVFDSISLYNLRHLWCIQGGHCDGILLLQEGHHIWI